MKSLVVFGQGWFFSVREPDGWYGDTDNAAKIYSKIVFYRNNEKWANATTLIWINVAQKDGPDVVGDLTADMARYRAHDSLITFEVLTIPHPAYQSFAKVYLEPKRPANYVVYLDPGKSENHYFIVTMEPLHGRASPGELKIFRSLTASVEMLGIPATH